MKVLSLFDGISAGQLALQRAGIAVDAYYASEIDKYAISVTDKNFPNTIQLGDVTKWREWDIPWGEIDLVIGGSPCQGFSFAGKQLNFNDPRSALFFVFVDICHRVADENPKMRFMLENVRMKKEYQDVITGYFGVEPIAINSSLVSAQNRYRLYWTNIPNVTQPDDCGILLRDIIESDFVDKKYYYSKTVLDRIDVSEINHVGMVGYKSKGKEVDKCGALLARHYKGMQSLPYPIVKEKTTGNKRLDETILKHAESIDQELITDSYNKTIHKEKSPTLTTRVSASNSIHLVKKDEENVLVVPEATKKGYTEVHPNEGVDLTFINSTTRRGRRMENKSNCLTATNYDYCFFNGFSYRKLTPIECERLQTFPDNWTEGISNTQRYKALGNSWTVDVVTHIFNNL
jgi:DNA-cytosine methyltransferase